MLEDIQEKLNNNKLVTVVSLIIFLLVIIFIIFIILKTKQNQTGIKNQAVEQKKVEPIQSLNTNNNATGATDNVKINIKENQEKIKESLKAAQEIPAMGFDDDFDGLLNDLEEKYKTNPKMSDTDGDRLDDYAEVVIYKTDPLNSDTDGDGNKDGDEVINGYNPNGYGKLLVNKK